MSNFPAFSEFKRALEEDSIFVDSFNLFLNLPVFANRLRYVKEAHDFHVSPNPNSKLLDFDQRSVLQWSYSHRLPLFWVSEFYYGYQLGRVLFSLPCEESTDNHDIAEYISKHSSSKEIQKFLLFLRGSFGEAYCLFWLDVERLKHTKHTSKKKDMVERIKRLYLRNGAPFEFDVAVRKSIYFSSCEAKTMADEIAVFTSSQCKVIAMIKKYWLEKYVRQVMKPIINGFQPDDSDTEGSDDEEDELANSLPRVIIDEGNEKEENAENQHKELSNMVETQPIYIAGKRKEGICSHQQMKAAPLFTHSAHSLFGLSNEQVVGEFEPQNLTSFMQASIRCNFAAGNPILSFFMLRYGDDEELENNPTNLLIFWLSIEFLLTRDEMKRWYNSVKSSHLDSDCPYFSLFHEYPLATDLDSLLELFIDDNSEFFVRLPNEVQSQLHLLIPKGLGKSLLLETQDYVCKKLQPFWEKYIVYENDLFHSECVKRKDIRHLSDAIQRQQSNLYHESRKAKNIMCSSFNLRDRLEIKRIWKAVEFTEAMVNPGLLHLPSRLSMQVYSQPLQLQAQKPIQEETSFRTSTPGDIGPISYKGINLIPMITTVSTKIRRTAFKLVRTTVYCSQPATMTAKLLKKPSLPGSFSDMMKNPDHIESFYNFLVSNGNGVEMGLVFWLAIEDMKDSISDVNNCKVKIRRIMRRFFKEGIDMTMYCKDSTIVELSSTDDPDPFLLMDAQAAIFKSLEQTWYEQYLNYLTDNHISEELIRSSKVEKRQKNNIQQPQISSAGRGHTKGLWSIFTKNVIGFRRGTMDPQILQLFKKYLVQEVMKGDIYDKKKIVGNKVVNVTKLLNDLSFWAEVERYKDMADVVRAAKNSGTYTPEDEIMVYKKAHAIVNCYIDSSVPPKIQVNVSPEAAATILENLSSSNIGRGLFHEAALNIFSILILYWKRFCIWRWTPNKCGSSSSMNSHSTAFSFTGMLGGNIQSQDSDDFIGGCVLSFSLRKGLRLIIPQSQGTQHYSGPRNTSNYSKVQVYKIESARAMISKHISRIT